MTSTPKPRFWKKRWLRWSAASVVALTLSCAGLVVYLLQRPPAVWRQTQEVMELTTESSRQTIRDNVMGRLSTLVHDPSATTDRPKRIGLYDEPLEEDADVTASDLVGKLSDIALDKTVKMELTNEELVAFVNEQFVQWTTERGYVVPGGVNDPAVISSKGGLVIAFMIDTPSWQQVFSGDLVLTFNPDGMAVGRVENLIAGSLPVSVDSVGDTLRRQMPASQHDKAERLGEWLDKLDHFEFRPVLELEHRRRARVLALSPTDNGVVMKLRVQDHQTYRLHNAKLKAGTLAVTDPLDNPALLDGSAFADVPTTKE